MVSWCQNEPSESPPQKKHILGHKREHLPIFLSSISSPHFTRVYKHVHPHQDLTALIREGVTAVRELEGARPPRQ